MKEHWYDINKSFTQGRSTWIPAGCGTKVCRGWFPHASHQERAIDCKKCLAILARKTAERKRLTA